MIEDPHVPGMPVAVVDVLPSRLRRPVDLVRLVGLVLVLVLLAVLGTIGSATWHGIDVDVARLVRAVPPFVLHTTTAVGFFAALALPLAMMVSEVWRGHTRRLVEAVVCGVLALAVVEGLVGVLHWIKATSLFKSLLPDAAAAHDLQPLDAYLAALLAFVAVLGLASPRPRRLLVLGVTLVYVVSAFIGTQASLLSLLSSGVVGALIGVAARYVAGQPNTQPSGTELAAHLSGRGLSIVRMERVAGLRDTSRVYTATTSDGTRLTLHTLDRDLLATGVLQTLYRLIRVRTEIAPAAGLSLELVAQRRTLLAMAAEAAEVATPRLLSAVVCGRDTVVLAYLARDTYPLREPSDAQLADLWTSVGRLHARQVTHRGLAPHTIGTDDAGQVVLPIATGGTAFATDLQVNVDRAQLLATCAVLAGPERAVAAAREALGQAGLLAVLPVLQPVVLPGGLRRDLNHDPELLDAVREQVQGATSGPVPELARLERIRPRAIMSVVALLVAGYLLIGQVGRVHLSSVLVSADWRWVPLIVAASAVTYFAAALSLIGYVREKLSFGRTVLAQLAASFAGFITPPSIGGLAVNVRYLRRAQLSTTAAATSLGMAQVVNAGAHIVLLLGFAAVTGASATHALPVPGWAFIALGALAAVGLLALAVPAVRRVVAARILPPLREALPRLLTLFSNPIKLAEAISGAMLLNAAYIAALWCAVQAFHGPVAYTAVAVVYLAGAAIGSLAPTPGGLGAVEVALSTGLVAAGMASSPAVSAVLLFRLATFWIPVPLGWIALNSLRRRQAL